MKILEVISDTNIGGAGVVLLTRINTAPSEYKNNTTVILPQGSALKKRFEACEIKVEEICIKGDKSFALIAIFKYKKLLKRLSPDIINCHGALSCRIAAYFCRVPIRLYTRHCAFPLSKIWKNKLYKRLISNIQIRLSNHVIAVAEAAKDNLTDMGIKENRITVIINGVDKIKASSEEEKDALRKKLNIHSGCTVIGIFARLEKCKGHDDFLNAAKIISENSTNFKFLIVGDGSAKLALKRKCYELGLDRYVVFTGFIENTAPYFGITDININCSNGTETSSLALSEGMSLGIPAVVSDFGGNPYMIRNGYNGFVYPVGDYTTLAKYIICLAKNREKYLLFSQNSKKRYKNEFNSKEMSRQTYTLYKELAYRHSIKTQKS